MSDDELDVRALLENWVVWRDAGRWDEFATLWHPSAQMHASWFEGIAGDFIAASRAAYERGVNVTHFLGGSAIRINGDRAIAQTKMSITQRAELQGQQVDVICTGRFYDFVIRDRGRWVLLERRVIYENDRVVPVIPGPVLEFDPELLARYPEGYRHLAYLQSLAGMTVRMGLPGRRGPESTALLTRGQDWLERG